jgi:hypothetical protein
MLFVFDRGLRGCDEQKETKGAKWQGVANIERRTPNAERRRRTVFVFMLVIVLELFSRELQKARPIVTI